MLALAICLALSAPEVFAASQGYEDPSRVAADMASQNMTSAQNVQNVSQTTQSTQTTQKPKKQKKLRESEIIKQVEAATPRPETSPALNTKD